MQNLLYFVKESFYRYKNAVMVEVLIAVISLLIQFLSCFHHWSILMICTSFCDYSKLFAAVFSSLADEIAQPFAGV